MANLKVDLLNKIKNDKYFEETELVRLAGEANMNYREKIEEMSLVIERIAIINAQIGLVEQYFQEPKQTAEGQPQQQVAPAQQATPPTPPKHQGQTHGE